MSALGQSGHGFNTSHPERSGEMDIRQREDFFELI
jgi:hypothetical protein